MIKYRVVKSIKRKGYPTSDKNYPEAHSEADNYEKNHSPKEYQAMKKVDSKLKSNELAGTHTKSGKFIISKKVPKKYRAEVAENHEKQELKAQRRLAKEIKKK